MGVFCAESSFGRRMLSLTIEPLGLATTTKSGEVKAAGGGRVTYLSKLLTLVACLCMITLWVGCSDDDKITDSPTRGACCDTGGSCLVRTPSECEGLSGDYQGNGTVCAPNPCRAVGACCAPSGTCVVTTSEACATVGGIYRGDRTTCDPSPCPDIP